MDIKSSESRLQKIANVAADKFRKEYDANILRASKSHIEFELRIKNVDKSTFLEYLNQLNEKVANGEYIAEIEFSTNLISSNVFEQRNDYTQYIRRFIFMPKLMPDGKIEFQTTNDFYSKKSLMCPIIFGDISSITFSINISLETQIAQFISNPAPLVRFKSRIIFRPTSKCRDNNDWRIELTATKQSPFQEVASCMKQIRNELFSPKITPANFATTFNFNRVNLYEIEIEFDGQVNNLNADNIIRAQQLLQSLNPRITSQHSYINYLRLAIDNIFESGPLAKKMSEIILNDQNILKRLLPSVISLTKNIYYSDIWPVENYCVTDKLDGERCLVFSWPDKSVILLSGGRIIKTPEKISSEISNKQNIQSISAGLTRVDELSIPVIDENERNMLQEKNKNNLWIVDAEYLGTPDKVGNTTECNSVVSIFDVICVEGASITNKNYGERIEFIGRANEFIAATGLPIDQNKKIIKVFGADTLKEAATILWPTKSDTEIPERNLFKNKSASTKSRLDGLIISELSGNYAQSKHYKWKPMHENTIDFYAAKCPQNIVGVKPFAARPGQTLYILFVGISHKVRERLGLGIISFYEQIFGEKFLSQNTYINNSDNISKEILPISQSQSSRRDDRAQIYSQINKADYYPIQFSPPNAPFAFIFYSDNPDLDGQIVELGLDDTIESLRNRNVEILKVGAVQARQIKPVKKSAKSYENTNSEVLLLPWKLRRIRHDRMISKENGAIYFGNDYQVACKVFINYFDPFYFTDLFSRTNSFFQKVADKEFSAANHCKRQLISTMMTKYFNHNKIIVDLASGRGADLPRYRALRIKTVLFIDRDATAISELVRRALQYGQRVYDRGNNRAKFIGRNFKRGGFDIIHNRDELFKKNAAENEMCIHAMVADLMWPASDLIADILQFGIGENLTDGVVCNFAFHFMCSSQIYCRNLLLLVSRLLRTGGHFMFTVLNGQKIFELLRGIKYDGEWTSENREDSVSGQTLIGPKYKIIKRYNGSEMAPFGQFIKIKVPFSDEMLEEPLCNIDEVIKMARLFHLQPVEIRDMHCDSVSANDANHRASNLNYNLSNEDSQFVDLHTMVVFKLTQESQITPIKIGSGNDMIFRIFDSLFVHVEPKKRQYYWLIFKKYFGTISRPYIMLDDIPEEMEYSSSLKIFRPTCHIGQRKLFLNELQFLTNNLPINDETHHIIYAGAAPLVHGPILFDLFPKIKWLLVDPNKFIINAQTTYIKNDTAENIAKKFAEGNEKIYIYNDLFTENLAIALKAQFGAKNLWFISDIRTRSLEDCPDTLDILWNLAQQYIWIRLMQPKKSMLKFRHPFYEEESSMFEKIVNERAYIRADFDRAKELGLDFMPIAKNHNLYYFDGEIFLQPWCGQSSTETRLVTEGENIINYGQPNVYENKLFFYNSISRGYVSHDSILFGKVNDMDCCNDCAIEGQIWYDYFAKKADPINRSDLNVEETINKCANESVKLSRLLKRSFKCENHGYDFCKGFSSKKNLDKLLSAIEYYSKKNNSFKISHDIKINNKNDRGANRHKFRGK